MQDDYGSKIGYRLKWLYTLLVVITLMLPVFYVMYISFNKNGFGARSYDFTFDWYFRIFSDKLLIESLENTLYLAAITMGMRSFTRVRAPMSAPASINRLAIPISSL